MIKTNFRFKTDSEIEALKRDLETACEWGAALWNTRDHAGHCPQDFYDNYVAGSRVVGYVDADTGEYSEVN